MGTYNLKTRASGRQTLIVAYLDILFSDLLTNSGNDAFGIEVPAGAVLLSGDLVVSTVWNSVTSDVLSVGDATTYNRYVSAVDLQAAARTALVPTGYVYTAPTLLTVRWVAVGTAPTTGAARVTIAYFRKGRADLGAQGQDYGSRLA